MSHTEVIDDVKNLKIIGIGAEGGALASKVLSIAPHLCVLFLQDQIPLSEWSGDEKNQVLKNIFEDTQLLFIASDITNVSNLYNVKQVADLAREKGILVLGVDSSCVSEQVLQTWFTHVDSLLVAEPEKLHANLHDAADKLAAIVYEYGHVNIDFEDVRNVLSKRGVVRLGTSTASGLERAQRAALDAIEDIDLKQAQGMLLILSASKGNLKMSDGRQVMRIATTNLPESAHIIYAATYDEDLGDHLRVTMLVSGLPNPNGVMQ